MLALGAERDLCGHEPVQSSLGFKNKLLCIDVAIFYFEMS